MKWGRELAFEHDLSSLRLLGSVGEPINRRHGAGTGWSSGRRGPIVDTWWQTETGAAMISPAAGVTSCKPGSAMRPLPGISAKIVDDHGNELPPATEHGEPVTGYLCPGQAVAVDAPAGIWGDHERFVETYWSRFADQGWYFAGDGALWHRRRGLGARPHRRRHERVRAPDIDRRGGVGSGGSCRGG